MMLLKPPLLRSRKLTRGRKEQDLVPTLTILKAKVAQLNASAVGFRFEKSLQDQCLRRSSMSSRQRLQRLRRVPNVMERKVGQPHPRHLGSTTTNFLARRSRDR